MAASYLRSFLLRATVVFLTLAITLVLVEVALRLLPVSDLAGSKPVNAQNPIFRFQENRDFVYSKGWNFSIINRLHVNNDGFVNNSDYLREDPRPLLAVVGDSYIEARQVPFPETLQGRLSDTVGSEGRVYSFAASGAPLSQYLVWAKYAQTTYQPQAMVFVVVGNDFDESLLEYGKRPGMHFFKEASDSSLQLVRVDYPNSLMRRLAGSSALSRYLYINLQLTGLANNLDHWLQAGDNKGAKFIGNTAMDDSPERLDDSKRAVNAFFQELPAATDLPAGRILFVLDGIRAAIYDPTTLVASEASYVGQMRRFFIDAAQSRGYEVIDLQPRFSAAYQRDQMKFEFPIDAHWNGLGHGIAAGAVRASRVFQDIYPAVNLPGKDLGAEQP